LSKINHNRPSLRYKDNLTKLAKALDRKYSDNQLNDDIEEPLDWTPSDPQQQKEWNVCAELLNAFQLEEEAFIKVLSIGRGEGESSESRKESREEAISRHKITFENTNKNIETYLFQFIEAKYSENQGVIFDNFHKATVRAAKKGMTMAIELLGRIEKVIEELPKHHKRKNPNN